MPASPESQNVRRWCKKFPLQGILIGTTSITILVVVFLLNIVVKQHAKSSLQICSIPICLIESSKIVEYVDFTIDPCEDFYQFSCGNFLKSAHGDEQLVLSERLHQQEKRQILELYGESIHENEHKMVKAAKKLFRACMNLTEIEKDNLETIKAALKAAGGWPVVESSNWNEETFDWRRTSYKLRELGYYFSTFLELKIKPDAENNTENIFEVIIPHMQDYKTRLRSKLEFMTEMALMFGAVDKQKVLEEMDKVHVFLVKLQQEADKLHPKNTYYTKFAVEEYQRGFKSIDWLDFINNIARPSAQITKNDYVVFPPAKNLASWIDLISRTPKRIQANCMMWRVIEATLPYLTDNLRNRNVRNRTYQTRDAFCLKAIQERFIPNPIEVLYDRKYLPEEKRNKVERLVSTIKSQLIEALRKVTWMDDTDKEKALEKANAIKFVIGQSGNYFDDKILDDLDADMMEPINSTFLSLIAQANRNYITSRFNTIKTSISDHLPPKWYMKYEAGVVIYSERDDVIFVPTISTEGYLYHENRPQYLNYGEMGTHLGQQFTGVLYSYLEGYNTTNSYEERSKKTINEGDKKVECMKKEMENYILKLDRVETAFIIQQSMGEQISYAAYEKWINNNGVEPKLIGIDYTPNQLFWISAMSTFCKPIRLNCTLPREEKLCPNMFQGSMRNNHQFARDFNCPVGSKMNPSNRCNLF